MTETKSSETLTNFFDFSEISPPIIFYRTEVLKFLRNLYTDIGIVTMTLNIKQILNSFSLSANSYKFNISSFL